MQSVIINKRIWGLMILILSLACFGACQEEALPEGELKCPVEAVEGPENDVVGKWKLVRRETVFFEPKVTDHSCDEILWNFRPDGYLSVNSNVQGLEHCSGEELRFEIIPISESRNFFILKIGSSKWPAGIIENKMTLNDAALDGPILEFIRIE